MHSGGQARPTLDLGALAPGLTATCEEYRVAHRGRLIADTLAGASGVLVASRHARAVDGLLGALFCAADAASRIVGSASAGRTALVAVGGYGRGVLGLESDLDVVLLCEAPDDPGAAALAEAILYPLWDLGLEVGHAVRSIEGSVALARSDLRTATALLDVRRLGGNATLVDELRSLARREVFEARRDALLDELASDTDARHARYGGSLFLLEPEVKNGVGGLRDLDVLAWSADIRWGARSIDEASNRGVLLPRETEELLAAREWLWRVRNLLHVRAGSRGAGGRRHDRLTFEDQEDVARALGFIDGEILGVEQFMQAFYRHARTVEIGVERVLSRARHRPTAAAPLREALERGVVSVEGTIDLDGPETLARDPASALRLYRQVARLGLPPSPPAREAIARAAADGAWAGQLRAAPEASALFLDHLTAVAEAPVRGRSLLQELHDVGLLLAMIPEFEPVTGRVHHDVYHVYTVDVHSVAAVDRLRALCRGEHALDLPLPTQLAVDVARPVPLFLAVLLHDIGKRRGRDHAAVGAEMAVPIGARLGLSHADVEHTRWLVQEHLSLYHWAMRRDVSDPATVAEVLSRVSSAERLADLLVLTVADLSTTHPEAMTSWKARMLEGFYVAAASWLEGVPGASEGRADELRREVCLAAPEEERATLEAFLASMPERYVLANDTDVIRAHARLAGDRGAAPVALFAGVAPGAFVSELVVRADDRPGLLADVAAVLASHRLDVTTAQVHTRALAHPEAFDVFHVRRTGAVEGEPIAPSTLYRVKADLEDLLAGRVRAEDLLARRAAPPSWSRRRNPAVATQVLIDGSGSRGFTIIDVFTRDREGLLHTIARTLHEQRLSIGLAKVSTEGDRAADVFYVTDERGLKLEDPARVAGVEAALRRALDALATLDPR